ncbi:unnamed protein product [Vitrella brassicaformis CCMP3155]|uniref:Carboxyvinyl-carboxyphosphonate phosphorylmutase n=1 Tax=Vitrella brassicaformis (strain CCMP3155) TaxID=1169540 RepID=A0A0G4G948_VITBC|nr:unnamed protein product [Vitrella brassicaformis CCMP3155]|mmetsp:Transcript_21911/g.53735  ORF Transcript_21911/g.53735 Transcript_21911/m.53735 type:complete len:296 (-) Transcript_21911:194-1081(-)|eukprot:CEM25098.1 unnamed protein product [Vitrella brassicaformis CCMP3155]
MSNPSADRLRRLLEGADILVMPCCYDALTAKLIEEAGFPLTFMSGFSVSAARGFPDTQLISYQEMVDTCASICATLKTTPLIGDGDNGYGNPVNVKRTVKGYAQAGAACVMIEDQVAPKRCGHTKGKDVISYEDACMKIQAAVDARNEGRDILILARTDARATHGLDEAIRRCQAFRRLGADITFLEAPQTEEEMRRYCTEVDGPKLANMLEGGKSPIIPPKELQAIGFKIVAYPLTLLSSGIKAMKNALDALKAGKPTDSYILPFEDLRAIVGFEDYYKEEERYATTSPQTNGK